jgi:hypothetical protein
MTTMPQAIKDLTARDLQILVRLPITQFGEVLTRANDLAVVADVGRSRSRLFFPRNGYAIWAENSLLLDNVDQFVVHDPENVPAPNMFDYVATVNSGKESFVIIDIDGKELARTVTEAVAVRIVAALLLASKQEDGPPSAASSQAIL